MCTALLSSRRCLQTQLYRALLLRSVLQCSLGRRVRYAAQYVPALLDRSLGSTLRLPPFLHLTAALTADRSSQSAKRVSSWPSADTREP